MLNYDYVIDEFDVTFQLVQLLEFSWAVRAGAAEEGELDGFVVDQVPEVVVAQQQVDVGE